MRRLSALAFSLAISGLFSACAMVHNSATNVIPINTINVAQLQKAKKGEACISSVFFIPIWGTNNISEAAKAGGITQIGFVEQKLEAYFIFNKFCTVVYGTTAGAAPAAGHAQKG